MEDLEAKFKDLFEVVVPEVKVKAKTFLEIARMPHYENVDSNILAFFFSKDGEHQLQDLFLRSLVEIVKSKIVEGSKEIDFDEWTVEREVITSKNTRIDLVIQSVDEDKVIIIENKIYHWLANDLQSYWNHYPEIKDENKIGIVLCLKATAISDNNFISISHKELNEGVLKNLQHYYLEANDRFLIYLKDFIDNKNRFYMNKTDKDYLLFYFANSATINELGDIKKKTNDYIYKQIELAGESLGFGISGKRSDQFRCYFFQETKHLYFSIFPNEIFSENPQYKVILEGHNVSVEMQQLLINQLNTINNEHDRGIAILSQPTKPYALLATKVYSFLPDNIENFFETLIKEISEDFMPLKNKVLPFFFNELGK